MLYMTLIMYGMATMRSVLEEKTSRVMEVMLSSVTPRELMTGKILGVGGVGLTQIAVWIVCLTVVSGSTIISSPDIRQALSIPLQDLLWVPIYFILGYMLYSSLYAALGAMVNSEQEAQQFQWFVTMPLIIPIVTMMGVIRQPDSAFATWMSMVPFFSPILMYVRIVSHTPPLWQIVLSIAILLATTYLIVALCSRIYRVGILMYGKRPTLPEIVKWVKYA
jgi:ABC-2 type transport system permease protein